MAGGEPLRPPAAPPELASDSPRRLSRNWFGGVGCSVGSGRASPATEDRRKTKPLRAREPPSPEGPEAA